jgi:hypothetical protein
MGAQRTSAEVYHSNSIFNFLFLIKLIYLRLDQLGALTATHRKIFADIAREAESLLSGQPEKSTPKTKLATDKHSICQQLAASRGRGTIIAAQTTLNINYFRAEGISLGAGES